MNGFNRLLKRCHARSVPAVDLDLDAVVASYRAEGYVLVRGLFSEAELVELEAECADAQARVAAGAVGPRYGTDVLDDPEATVDGARFAHYVTFVTELSPAADAACRHPVLVSLAHRLLGDDPWLSDDDRFGVVYQDARTGDGTYYSRIGWHTDRQSGPHLDVWPSMAFTIHLDPTSPANGFLRVVPGSHLGPTDGMPPAFERVPGEVAVYADRGDVLLHDADLWHGAARATDDGAAGVRRHVRGGWYGGTRLPSGYGVDDFVKNAAR